MNPSIVARWKALESRRLRELARADRWARVSRRVFSRAVSEHERAEPATSYVTTSLGATFAFPSVRTVTLFPLEKAPSFPRARHCYEQVQSARAVAARYGRALDSLLSNPNLVQ